MNILNNCLAFAHRILQNECVLCGAAVRTQSLCTGCHEHLPHLRQPRCRICALPIPVGDLCGSCMSDPPAFQCTRAAFIYSFPVDALVQSLKYQGNLALAPVLAVELLRNLDDRPDYLIPVPLSTARLRERGFNQALEIARVISKKLGVRLLTDACRRVLDNPPQAGLPWKDRAKNVRGAFLFTAELREKKIALLDDVMTTGATLNELAKAARKKGAIEISAWVVARTLPP
ncbi:MAG TPA: ComF family protein [Burkholderiales bacterium]|nr:ComF family protein [Burkholderiales bacterium]